MSLNNPQSSGGSVAEFMSSALPWVTSSIITTSPQRYDFAKITKQITVRNLGGVGSSDLAVGFTRNGVLGSNRFLIPVGSIVEMDVRVKELYLVGVTGGVTASVYAGLTTAPAHSMPTITGSLWDGVG